MFGMNRQHLHLDNTYTQGEELVLEKKSIYPQILAPIPSLPAPSWVNFISDRSKAIVLVLFGFCDRSLRSFFLVLSHLISCCCVWLVLSAIVITSWKRNSFSFCIYAVAFGVIISLYSVIMSLSGYLHYYFESKY